MLPPAERLIGAQLHRYVEDSLYWTLHAPRQTGKTTFLQSWMREINTEAKACACYVSVETSQGVSDPAEAMPTICTSIREHAIKAELPLPPENDSPPREMLSAMLRNWAELVAPKPLVVLFDEVDVLQGEAMISFLRQLRSGFATRGIGLFPSSIALVGMRDLKDYITASKDGIAPNPGSPFNVKEDSAVIGNFARDDLARLFAQRTAETGQQITTEALDYLWDQSHGQPWIVNNLLKRITMRILDATSTQTVHTEHAQAARQQMIQARETHLEALAYRMQDPRVRNVMEKLLTGETDLTLAESEGFRLCADLGLVTSGNAPPQVANPIYKEVLARQISSGAQAMLPERETWRWQAKDGTLDMDNLLREFQKFWRRHSEVWEQTSNYTEAFPHLLLMAFLQRITNGDGRIEREYAAGRGRMDLLVEYKGKAHILEIKLIHDYDTPEIVREEGVEQILAYRDKTGLNAPAYLLIFDRRTSGKKLPWEQRITWNNTPHLVTIIGC